MDQVKIGKFIAEQRKEKKLTQAQLAEKLNITDRAVSKWESGICLPDVSLFIPLCKIFEIDLNELFLGEKIAEEKVEEKLEESFLPIIKKYQKITKAKKILIILFFILLPLILLQWNLKFYTAALETNPFYLIALIYIPAYILIYKNIKLGYILSWSCYILLSFIFLVKCNFYVEWLFNSYSIDVWFHIIITILSLVNGDINYKNLIQKN